MAEVTEKHWGRSTSCPSCPQDEDGFLYLTFSGENTFGAWELAQ